MINHSFERSGIAAQLSFPSGEDHIAKQVAAAGDFYEAELLDTLAALLEPGDLVLDIGANVGNHTIFFSLICGCEVISFEPNPEALLYLRANVQQNAVASRVQVMPYAVGKGKGKARIAVEVPGNLGALALTPSDGEGDFEIVSLDGQSFPERVRLVKIDVEGMETDVLQGALGLIEHDRPYLVIEAATEKDFVDVDALMKAVRYTPVAVFGSTATYLYSPAENFSGVDNGLLIGMRRSVITAAGLKALFLEHRETRKTVIKHTQAVSELREGESRAKRQLEELSEDLSSTVRQIGEIEKEINQVQVVNALNREAIKANEASIKSNKDAIKSNEDSIKSNKDAINSNDRKLIAEVKKLRAELAHCHDQLSLKIEHVNSRHDALLNGRLFSTLNKAKSVIRRIVPRRTKTASVQAAGHISVGPADQVESARIVKAEPQGQAVASKHLVPNIASCNRMERSIESLRAAHVALPGKPLVSVVMTTYNSDASVAAAIESVLAQTHRELELIIVDDASTDRTCEVLHEKAGQDSRIRIIESAHNRGTYWSKNSGIIIAKGDVITFMDSDDVIDPRRLEKQLAAIGSGLVGSTCNYVRKDEAGNIVLNRGLEQRIGLITLMVKKQVFSDIGYFDSVRTSADDEMVQRIKLVYGDKSLANVAEPLYTALLRENSLTTAAGNSNNLASTDAGTFLSDARKRYVEGYKDWHKKVSERGLVPYVPFPNTNRPFTVENKLQISGSRFEKQPVMAFMASFPPRIEKLRLAVESLLPQVDRIYIYLNNYESVPDFLRDERIQVEIGGQDLRDNGKIFHMEQAPDGYFFTVDDDIEYPDDYCEHLVRAIEKYDRKAVVGVHGVILGKPFVRYFSPDRTVFSFKHALAEDEQVNILGTGTVAFHSSLMRPCLLDFRNTGMADIWMAILSKNKSAPMMAVSRKAAWLTPIAMGEEGPTLFDEFFENDKVQTEVLRSYGDWSVN